MFGGVIQFVNKGDMCVDYYNFAMYLVKYIGVYIKKVRVGIVVVKYYVSCRQFIDKFIVEIW